MEDEVKDIDVNVQSRDSRAEVLQLWKELLVGYEVSGEYSIFTFTPPEGLSIDLFINEESFLFVTVIDGVHVVPLAELIRLYHGEVEGKKREIEFVRDVSDPKYRALAPQLIDKHNRLLERLKKLLLCYTQKK